MTTHPLPDGRIPVLLSAHDPGLVRQDATAILKYLSRGPTVNAVSFTLLRTRRVRGHRALVRAADCSELAAALEALVNDDEHPLVARSSATAAPRTAFVFPGQGNQWPSMGAEAYQRLSAYRAEADRCAAAFCAAGLPSPLPYLVGDSDQDWSQIHIQGAQFTHAVSLARVWQCCGILPDVTVGHSLGEVAAAQVAGTVTLDDAVAAVAARAAVVEQLPGHYGMAVLGIGVEEAERLISEIPGWLEVSAVNATASVVVSGERDAVAAIVALAENNGTFARQIDVEYPGHTSALQPLRVKMAGLLPKSAFLDAPVEFIGSARGAVVHADTDFVDYWCDNLCNTVRFDHAVEAAIHRDVDTFIEMSAHPSLLGALADLADDALIIGSGRRDEPVVDQLSANIAAAAVANPRYRWADVAGVGEQSPLPGFPNAPMKAVHLWATREPLPPPPGSDLTVAFEEWELHPEAGSSSADRSLCRVAVVGTDQLAHRLNEAVAGHDGCEQAEPHEAEIAVLIAPPLLQPEARDVVDEMTCAIRQLDYKHAVGPRCRRVWLVTARGERVNTSEAVALPAQAALAAMHRSVGFEYPDATFAHLDLSSPHIDAQTAQACVDVLLGDCTEVALREQGPLGTGPQRYIRTLCEPRQAAPERPLDAAALESVVITGGSGGIGLRYARHCIARGARRLILLSRKGVDPAELDRLVEEHCAQVYAPTCDITDPDAVAVVASEYGGEGASLLIHAAGAARFGPHDQLTDADLADVFAAKVTGLVRMTEIWPLRNGARILLCSSVSGVWGGYGHAAYAASNRVLDVVADQLRTKGLDAVAVRWGLWRGTGIASEDEITRIERSGLLPMDPEAAISASLRHHAGDPLILAADTDRLQTFFESQGVPIPFANAPAAPDPEPTAVDDGSATGSVVDVVRAEVARVLSLPRPESVDLSAALVDLGVDSLLALDLRKRLRKRTGASVALARLLGGMTGAELVDTLESGARTSRSESQTLERVESSRD